MKPRRLSFARLPLALAAAIAAMFSSAHGITITWDADGATPGQADGAGDWLASGQWWDEANNVDWTSGDDAVFGNSGAGGAVTLSSPTTVNSLTLNSFTDTYTLGAAGQVITLNTGIAMNAGAGATTIISPLTLGGDQSWLNDSSSLLTVGTGAVDNGGFLLTVSGTGATFIQSAIGGAGGFTKINAGPATLGATGSSYTGATTISGGILRITTVADAGANSPIGAFPTAGATGLILNGGTLEYTGATASTNRGFTVNSNSTINVATAAAKLTMGDFTINGTNTFLTLSGGLGSTLALGTFNHNVGQNRNFTTNIPVSFASIASTVGQGVLNTGGSLMTIGDMTGTGFFLGGGQILVTGTVNLAGNLTNNQTTGTITYTGSSFLLPTGSLRMFDGNTFAVGGSSTLGSGGIFARGIVFRGASTFLYNSSANQTLSGNITFTGTNGGKVTMSGAGILTLTGLNTYSGDTTVNAGTLLVNNASGSGTGVSNVSVTAGTLGGSGSITGAVTLGDSAGSADAILAPGGGADASLNTGNLTFNGDGRYAAELNGTAVTTDVTNVTGSVTINSTATLAVSLTGSLAGGQKYFIVVNDGTDLVAGTFSGLAQGATVGNYGGTDLKISYVGDSVGGTTTAGNDIVLYTDSTASAWDTWKTANTLPGSDGPDDDSDGDGVTNAVEFVLGGTKLTNDLGKLPVPDASGSNLTFTFKRAISSIDPKTALFIETSTDLATWNTAPSPYSVPDVAVTNNPGVTVVEDMPAGFDTVTLSVAKGLDAKKFARLKVVITP